MSSISRPIFFNVNYKVERTFLGFFEIMALFMGFGTVAVWYFGGHAILDLQNPSRSD